MFVSIPCSNTGICPYWGISVSVYGVYGEKSKGTWSFLRAECPIIQNSKLPPYDQDERYKYMFCKNPYSCQLYTQFQPSITSEK